MTEPLSQRKKVQKLTTEIGGGCYMKINLGTNTT